ncbi:MAG: ABC transporter ATP-binding protein [Acetobacteraceae bacterium]|nr:ABC transporter ATP-binding protein [Acetobacteraceae bacterium]
MPPSPHVSFASGDGPATVHGLVAWHFRTSAWRVAGLAALSLLLAASAVLPSIVIARAVDAAIGGRLDAWAALIAGGGIAILAAWDAGLTLARRRLAIVTEIGVRGRAAKEHFRACVRLPMRDYAGGNEAALIRSFDDLDRVVEFVASRSVELLAEALIAAAAVTVMLWVEWPLALVFILLAVLSLATATRLSQAAKESLDAWLPVRDSRFGYIVECVTSMLTIKTLSAHAHVVRPFLREQELEQERLRDWRNRTALAESVTRFWGMAVPGIGIVCGAIMLIGGALTAGELLLFLSLSSGLGGALGALQSHLREWQEARAALARMRSLGIGMPEALEDEAVDAPTTPYLRIDSLGFRHLGARQDTLDDLRLDIAAGEHVAIVGRSGEGKTTLAHLLARLHDLARGTIAVGEGPAMTLDRHRRAVLLVPHVTAVFNASLRDNVRLWDETVDDAAVWRALDLAELRVQAAAWEGGLDAPLGSRGNPLSAGQQQRLGLARAFTRRPSVLILDEATSAMDRLTETDVLRNVRAFMRGHVLIVITHREAVAATFDRVLRVERGHVVMEPPSPG